MTDKDYEKLIKEIKKKRLDSKVKKILELVESRKIETARWELLKEFCISTDIYIDPKWAVENILKILPNTI
jgi:hypothetical protein